MHAPIHPALLPWNAATLFGPWEGPFRVFRVALFVPHTHDVRVGAFPGPPEVLQGLTEAS